MNCVLKILLNGRPLQDRSPLENNRIFIHCHWFVPVTWNCVNRFKFSSRQANTWHFPLVAKEELKNDDRRSWTRPSKILKKAKTYTAFCTWSLETSVSLLFGKIHTVLEGAEECYQGADSSLCLLAQVVSHEFRQFSFIFLFRCHEMWPPPTRSVPVLFHLLFDLSGVRVRQDKKKAFDTWVMLSVTLRRRSCLESAWSCPCKQFLPAERNKSRSAPTFGTALSSIIGVLLLPFPFPRIQAFAR